jgi:cytosine/adenosine deaminase-related metal-dependent hydrolase
MPDQPPQPFRGRTSIRTPTPTSTRTYSTDLQRTSVESRSSTALMPVVAPLRHCNVNAECAKLATKSDGLLACHVAETKSE